MQKIISKTKIGTDNQPLIRIETGPLEIDDDWPGVFIRGDNALYLAMMLQTFFDGHDDFILRVVIKGLIDDLKSCDVKKEE